MVSSWDIITLGFLGSFAAGMMTTVGAAGIVFVRKLSTRTEDILLSAAAGIMLAASVFSLLLPGIDIGQEQGYSKSNAVLVVLAGMLIGAALLAVIHRYTPHQHFKKTEPGVSTKNLRRIWLFVLAITLHNFPEGMAVGVGFANGDINNGMSLAIGIGLQNIPEGLAVAVALMTVGYSRGYAFMIAMLTGLVEPVGGLLGATLVSFSTPLLPWILGGAAGAMMFIISDEIIPETHRHNHQSHATFSLLIGFSVMMYLDTVLG